MLMGLLGGVLIGAAAVWLYLSLGRVAGISGIAANVMLRGKENLWAILFLIGMGTGGWLAYGLLGVRPEADLDAANGVWFAVGGLLVGFGTRLGSGCTSGHGVCGMARFSRRSLVATLTFVGVGMLTATSVAWL